MLNINDIRMRDSFIVADGGVYYLYGTIGEQSGEKNLYVFKSRDLENFEEAKIIFTLQSDSWGKQELWAPEVHCFRGKWYLFISILGHNGLRGTQIAVSDAPDGVFEPVANRPATPLDKSCIDGTLYVENDVPYIVYSRDWPDNFVEEKGAYVGQIAAQELSPDLKEPIGEPFILFESDEAPISAGRPAVHEFFGKTVTRYGSDGPFLMKLKNGRLLLLWSPIPKGNYLIASAYSEDGIKGKFIHNEKPVFDEHGGHAMLFKDFENKLRMSFHWPERNMDERTRILTVKETETALEVTDYGITMDIIKYYVDQFNINDEEFIKNDIDNEKAYEWMKKEIPLFTCSDKDIERAYYFRWWTYRKHIKSTDDGVIITEFLPRVPWSGEHNAIIAPVGHHLCEGRWLRGSEKYLKSYIKFFLQKCTHSFDYSTWFISAIYEYSAITGDFDFGDDFIDLLEKHYQHWEETHQIADGSFWSIDGYDAMEFSVSGTDEKLQTMRGIRPTLNSYMCANALALSKFATAYGDTERAEKYLKKYEFLKNFINENLFEDGFFRAYHYYDDEDPTKAKDKKQVFPKELIGFIPFMFDIPEKGREECFDLLLDDKCFYNEYGLTSLEKTNERFLYEVDHECLWNGYIWPFATAQTLTALIKVAKGSDSKKYSDMFVTLLSQYAKMHKRVTGEGKTIDWIDEVMSPVDGSWSSREVLKNWGWREGKGGYERGKDYNHSTFCDLVISGLAGVGVRDGKLTVNPVLSDDIEYFMLNNLKVLGKEYEISYTKENGITIIEH